MASTLVSLPREVIDRSGQRAPFDAERIRNALLRAGVATGEYGLDEAALLTAPVSKVLIHRFHGEAPTIGAWMIGIGRASRRSRRLMTTHPSSARSSPGPGRARG